VTHKQTLYAVQEPKGKAQQNTERRNDMLTQSYCPPCLSCCADMDEGEILPGGISSSVLERIVSCPSGSSGSRLPPRIVGRCAVLLFRTGDPQLWQKAFPVATSVRQVEQSCCSMAGAGGAAFALSNTVSSALTVSGSPPGGGGGAGIGAVVSTYGWYSNGEGA
jgi:hypothetical protein